MKWLTKRKIFIDCGCNKGLIIDDFISKKPKYFNYREDSINYDFFGFDYKKHSNWSNIEKKVNVKFFEKLVWVDDCKVEFTFNDYNEGNFVKCNDKEFENTKRQIHIENKVVNTQLLDAINLSDFIIKNFTNQDYIVLKIDIEASEYVVLPHLIETGALNYINELYVEFHLRYFKDEKKHNEILEKIKNTGIYFKEWH